MNKLLIDLEERVTILENREVANNVTNREERTKVQLALASGKYDEIISSGGHGLIQLIVDTLSKDLGFTVRYSTVYYILKLK